MSKIDVEILEAQIILEAAKRPNPKLSAEEAARILKAAQNHYDATVELTASFPKEMA